MSTRRPFIVTPGEPAGIGAEITIKSWHAGQRDICVIESPDRLADIAAKLGIPLFIRAITQPDQFIADDQTLNGSGPELGILFGFEDFEQALAAVTDGHGL